MVAQAVPAAGEALRGAGFGQGGKVRVRQIRRGQDLLHAGGHFIGAVRALFHIFISQQFAGGLAGADVHGVLQGGGHVGQTLHLSGNGLRAGYEEIDKFLIDRGHESLL